MGSQTAHGYPYPVGTDRVMDGDDAIKALADKVEANVKGGIVSGAGQILNVPNNGAATLAVTFPVGRFTAAPNVTAGVDTGAPHLVSGSVTGISATGCTLVGGNRSGAIGAIWVTYIASQM